MKRSAALFAFLLLATSCTAQQWYFRVGVQATHYNMLRYNQMVDSYNEAHPDLDKPLPYLGWMMGPDIGLGKRYEYNSFEGYVRSSWSEISAAGTDTSGEYFTRYLKAKDTHVGCELGLQILPHVSLTFGMDISMFKTQTKVNEEEYRLKDKHSLIGISPGLKIWIGKKWYMPVINFYYACPFLYEDHTNTWAELGPDNFADQEIKMLHSKPNHFGISFSFAIGKKAEEI
jgi:hypothetical protein